MFSSLYSESKSRGVLTTLNSVVPEAFTLDQRALEVFGSFLYHMCEPRPGVLLVREAAVAADVGGVVTVEAE